MLTAAVLRYVPHAGCVRRRDCGLWFFTKERQQDVVPSFVIDGLMLNKSCNARDAVDISCLYTGFADQQLTAPLQDRISDHFE